MFKFNLTFEKYSYKNRNALRFSALTGMEVGP